MPKKYRLKKDFGFIHAGSEIYKCSDDDGYIYFFHGGNHFRFPNHLVENLSEWFEPVIEYWQPKSGEKFYYLQGACLMPRLAMEGTPNPFWHNNSLPEYVFKTEEKCIEARKRMFQALEEYHREIGE